MGNGTSRAPRAVKWWKALAGRAPQVVSNPAMGFHLPAHQTLVLSAVAAIAAVALGVFVLLAS